MQDSEFVDTNGKKYGLGWLDYGARMYDNALGKWHVVDPMAEKRNWISNYNYTQNNPVNRLDPDGMLDRDFLNIETGEITHVNDGVDQVVMVNSADYHAILEIHSRDFKDWNDVDSYNSIMKNSPSLDWNSDIGILARINMGEMGGLNQGIDARRIVSESVLNRRNYSGIYNLKKNSKSDISTIEGIVKDGYDGVNTGAYKNPYKYLNSFDDNPWRFGRDNIRNKVFASSIYAAYLTYNNTKPFIGKGVIYYGSDWVTEDHIRKSMAPYANKAGHLTILKLNIKGISAAGALTK